MQDLVDFFVQAIGLVPQGLSSPLTYFSEPSRRTYWLFLLSSFFLVFFAYYLRFGRISFSRILRLSFSPKYWFNKSSAQDVGWLTLNSVLKISLLIPLFGSHLWATIIVARFLQGNFGNAPELAWPLMAIMLSYTLVFFIVEDLSRFSLHVALHKIPWLWHFHKVHHNATVLTPLTVHRLHPVEMLLYFIRGTCIFGLVSGTFVYFFGSKLGGLEILGVDALGFLFNILGANLRHSHIWLSFGVFERWFISPAQHQIHHSIEQRHYDTNFGTCLACWDRWLGSWRSGRKRIKLRFGVA